MGCKNSCERKVDPLEMSRSGSFQEDCPDFMILFKDDDYLSDCICNSLVENAILIGKKLPGSFRAINLKEVRMPDTKIRIKGPPELCTMYVKLHCKNIYVKSDIWENEYFDAQIRESISVWTNLGAKKITWSTYRSKNAGLGIDANVNVSVPNTQLSGKVGIEYDSKEGESGTTGGEIEIEEPHMCPMKTFNDFVEHHNYFYVKNAPRWEDIINQKIYNPSVKHLEFHSEFTKSMNCSTKISAKFSKIGIGFGLSSEKSDAIRVKYDVEF